MQDREFLAWIAVASDTTVVAAVCGGSLLAGAAGMLRTRRATTHPRLMGALKNFAGSTSPDRVVDEGAIITAGGVTAAIDLGLYLCEKIAGKDAREEIRQQMDYPHYRVS
jgi:cyclohexyl-isocyanide hydratase